MYLYAETLGCVLFSFQNAEYCKVGSHFCLPISKAYSIQFVF